MVPLQSPFFNSLKLREFERRGYKVNWINLYFHFTLNLWKLTLSKQLIIYFFLLSIDIIYYTFIISSHSQYATKQIYSPLRSSYLLEHPIEGILIPSVLLFLPHVLSPSKFPYVVNWWEIIEGHCSPEFLMWDTLGTLPTIAYALGFRVCKVVILGFGFYYLSKHIYIYKYINV